MEIIKVFQIDNMKTALGGAAVVRLNSTNCGKPIAYPHCLANFGYRRLRWHQIFRYGETKNGRSPIA